jgi:putative ABC transport system permease protein
MITEMFISFIILFALSSIITNSLYQYSEPKGYEYENVWIADMWFGKKSEEAASSPKVIIDLLKKNLLSIPDVMAVSNCSDNWPYSMSTNSSSMKYNEVQYHNLNVFSVDTELNKALNIDVSDGRWFGKEDFGLEKIPIVVNREFKELFFPDETAVGKELTTGFNADKFKIVGYVENYKIKGELSKTEPMYFRMIRGDHVSNILVIKTKPGAGKGVEEQLVNALKSIPKDWRINVKKITSYRNLYFKLKLVPILVLLSVCSFLIINIILGLFGTLLYNINNRKPEIGLRRSIGAPKGMIYQQFIGEMLMLTTLGIIPGIIVAIQFPLLKAFEIDTKIFVLAIIYSLAIIYLLVFIASFIPSRYAAKTEPAIALHEE